uniref:Chorein_N domain-containing protein n=1 Tax=Macrostomum lignano TaxID=282301 RepID=A0A1I8FZQ3_9PLAT
MTELLDLPAWLYLRSARCNRVAIRCQWTKLKKVPLCLRLDQVLVEVEAVENPPPPGGRAATGSNDTSGKEKTEKYGFADKVIDGMDVTVNSLSKLHLYSVMANWARGELKFTYLRDRAHDQILLFKEMVWDTTRIEAGVPGGNNAIVRLVTNASRIRMAMKKRLSDSRILATRLELLLDDLLWVLTVSQLEATVLFVKSLQSCIEKATAKQQAASRGAAVGDIKHRPQGHTRSSSSVAAATSNAASATHSAAGNPEVDIDTLGPAERIFRKYDVSETSYHVHTGRRKPATFLGTDKRRHQLPASSLSVYIDYTQYYCPSSASNTTAAVGVPSPSLYIHLNPMHVRLDTDTIIWLSASLCCDSASTFILCISSRKPATFLGTDKRRHQLPASSLSVYIDYTQYYCPSSASNTTAAVGVPSPSLYIHLNPMHVRLDTDTIIWLSAFAANLTKN